jgi:hypothetical protein
MAARLLYCHCAYAQAVPKVIKQDVLRALTDSGVDFDAVADLCEMSARKDPALANLVAEGDVRIAACYPRAVKWLFSAAGAPLPTTGVTVLNMRTETAANVVAGMMSAEPPDFAEASSGKPFAEASSGKPVEAGRSEEGAS